MIASVSKAILGWAVGSITGSKYIDTTQAGIERAKIAQEEARGTLKQRNWRPDWMYRLRTLVSWYVSAPFISYFVSVFNYAFDKNVPVLNWQLIWSTTGIPLFVLTTTMVSIYTGGRSMEKIQGGASPGRAVIDSLKEVVVGRAPSVSRNPNIAPIDDYGIDAQPHIDLDVIDNDEWQPAQMNTMRRSPANWK